MRVICSTCRRISEAPDSMGGRYGRCEGCSSVIILRAASAEELAAVSPQQPPTSEPPPEAHGLTPPPSPQQCEAAPVMPAPAPQPSVAAQASAPHSNAANAPTDWSDVPVLLFDDEQPKPDPRKAAFDALSEMAHNAAPEGTRADATVRPQLVKPAPAPNVQAAKAAVAAIQVAMGLPSHFPAEASSAMQSNHAPAPARVNRPGSPAAVAPIAAPIQPAPSVMQPPAPAAPPPAARVNPPRHTSTIDAPSPHMQPDPSISLLAWLSGRKTYLTAAAIFTLAMLKMIWDISVPDWVWATLAAAALSFLRAGMDKAQKRAESRAAVPTDI
jgi:hypothetical protein